MQVMHGPASGSHPIHLLPVTKELLERGNSVTTVRFKEAFDYGIFLQDLGENHTYIELAINNADGQVPWTSKVLIGHLKWCLSSCHLFRNAEVSSYIAKSSGSESIHL